MNTCKTCKWWAEQEFATKFGDCNSPRNPRNDWKLNLDGAYGHEETFYGHFFGISTGPDFGCIHHEAKE